MPSRSIHGWLLIAPWRCCGVRPNGRSSMVESSRWESPTCARPPSRGIAPPWNRPAMASCGCPSRATRSWNDGEPRAWIRSCGSAPGCRTARSSFPRKSLDAGERPSRPRTQCQREACGRNPGLLAALRVHLWTCARDGCRQRLTHHGHESCDDQVGRGTVPAHRNSHECAAGTPSNIFIQGVTNSGCRSRGCRPDARARA